MPNPFINIIFGLDGLPYASEPTTDDGKLDTSQSVDFVVIGGVINKIHMGGAFQADVSRAPWTAQVIRSIPAGGPAQLNYSIDATKTGGTLKTGTPHITVKAK